MIMTRTVRRGAAVLAVLALATGCASHGGAAASDTSKSGASASGSSAYPVTVDNCGVKYTFDKAPSRTISMNQDSTEPMLALGLGSHLIGTAYMDDAIRPDLKTAYDKIPILSAQYPSKEQILAKNPDFVLAALGSAFADTAAGSRVALKKLGINTLLPPSQCPEHAGPRTIDQVEQYVTDLGRIYDVPDRARTLNAAIKKPIDQVKTALAGVKPVTVFDYDSLDGNQAFTAGGWENTSTVITLAGGTNVFSSVDKNWMNVSWEQVVHANPDYILINDYGKTTVAQKEHQLESNPATASLNAVKNKRFVVLELADLFAGIRNGDAVLALAKQLHPDRF